MVTQARVQTGDRGRQRSRCSGQVWSLRPVLAATQAERPVQTGDRGRQRSRCGQVWSLRPVQTGDRGRQRSRCGQVWSLRPKYRLGIEGASGHAVVRCGHSGPGTDWR